MIHISPLTLALILAVSLGFATIAGLLALPSCIRHGEMRWWFKEVGFVLYCGILGALSVIGLAHKDDILAWLR